MGKGVFSYAELEKILLFLAEEQNTGYDEFLNRIWEKIQKKEERLSLLAREISRLNPLDREFVFTRARSGTGENLDFCLPDAKNNSEMRKEFTEKDDIYTCKAEYKPDYVPAVHVKNINIEPFKYFLGKSISDLVKSKPVLLIINGETIKVKSWKEVSVEFIRFLINKNDLSVNDLPLCPNPRSAKAFVNSIPGQPPGSGKTGLFVKIADNFYVDIKLNAKYHILNIWRTLELLNLTQKYDIYIGLRKDFIN